MSYAASVVRTRPAVNITPSPSRFTTCFFEMEAPRRRKLWIGMLLTLCFIALAHSHFSSFKTHNDSNWWKVTVPDTGFYLISIIVDPVKGKSVQLSMETTEGTYTAYGEHVVGSLEVPQYMLEGQNISLVWGKGCREFLGVASALSITYVSTGEEGKFSLFTSPFLSKYPVESAGDEPVPFTEVLYSCDQVYSRGYYNAFRVSYYGIYWISARPDPVFGKSTNVDICTSDRRLFTISAGGGKAVSTSGAFYLEADSILMMRKQKKQTLKQETILSVTYLALNRKPSTGSHDHVAWTSCINQEHRKLQRHIFQTVPFKESDNALTNYGDMYNSKTFQLVIPVAGNYLVSIRMADITCLGGLYVNGKLKWWVYNEQNSGSGQTAALHLNAQDSLSLYASSSNPVGVNTMMSVAFVSP